MNDADARQTIVAVDTAFASVRRGGRSFTCARCAVAFPAISKDDRCVLCHLGAFFGRATVETRARFIFSGQIAC